jgi:hypothetical protein
VPPQSAAAAAAAARFARETAPPGRSGSGSSLAGGGKGKQAVPRHGGDSIAGKAASNFVGSALVCIAMLMWCHASWVSIAVASRLAQQLLVCCADLEAGVHPKEEVASNRRAGALGVVPAKGDEAEAVGLLSGSRSGA